MADKESVINDPARKYPELDIISSLHVPLGNQFKKSLVRASQFAPVEKNRGRPVRVAIAERKIISRAEKTTISALFKYSLRSHQQKSDEQQQATASIQSESTCEHERQCIEFSYNSDTPNWADQKLTKEELGEYINPDLM